MTDIDPRADLGLHYNDGDLVVVIQLVGHVSEMWCRRYESLAQASDVRAQVRGSPDGPAMLVLTVPAKAKSDAVPAMLDRARRLIAVADEVEHSPGSSGAPEAVVRQWWARQRAG